MAEKFVPDSHRKLPHVLVSILRQQHSTAIQEAVTFSHQSGPKPKSRRQAMVYCTILHSYVQLLFQPHVTTWHAFFGFYERHTVCRVFLKLTQQTRTLILRKFRSSWFFFGGRKETPKNPITTDITIVESDWEDSLYLRDQNFRGEPNNGGETKLSHPPLNHHSRKLLSSTFKRFWLMYGDLKCKIIDSLVQDEPFWFAW